MITPVRPITEPIDRSIPPVMMTNEMPMAKMPSIETWRVVLSTLEAPRKSWLVAQRPRHRSTRATNIPSSRLMPPSLLGAAGHELRDALGGEAGAGQDARDPPLAHHHHPVAHAEHLFHLGADHQDREALRGQGRHVAVDLRLGPHVDAPRGLVEDQHPGLHGQPLAQHDLLLVAAREVHHPPVDRRRLDPEARHLVLGDALLADAVEEAEAGVAADRRKRGVLGDGHGQHQAVALAVLGRQAHPALDGVAGAARQERASLELAWSPKAPGSRRRGPASARSDPSPRGRRSRGSRRGRR